MEFPSINEGLSSFPTVPITSLQPLQGDLKDLSKREYEKLKKRLLERGIIVPFFVWANDGIIHLLDGHQRQRVFLTEGWHMSVPVLQIHADSLDQAKQDLLAISSQYGRITQEGWDEFTAELDENWILETVNFDALPYVFDDNFEPFGVTGSDGSGNGQIDGSSGTIAGSEPIPMIQIVKLMPHPRNYRSHEGEQLDQLRYLVSKRGVYKPIVISRDNVILQGLDLVEAATLLGMEEVPYERIDVDHDSIMCLKLLVHASEFPDLDTKNDRALTDLLKEIHDRHPEGLVGTGFTPEQLAAYAMVTRPMSEIQTIDEAAHWVGMPEYQRPDDKIKIVLTMINEDDALHFLNLVGIDSSVNNRAATSGTITAKFPDREKRDLKNIRFDFPDSDLTDIEADGEEND